MTETTERPGRKPPKDSFTIRIDPQLRARVNAEARQLDRSEGWVVRRALLDRFDSSKPGRKK
jgi:predicted transcriptional regulator